MADRGVTRGRGGEPVRHGRGRHRKRGRWHWALLGTYRLGAQLGLGQQQSLSVMQVGGWDEENGVIPIQGMRMERGVTSPRMAGSQIPAPCWPA